MVKLIITVTADRIGNKTRYIEISAITDNDNINWLVSAPIRISNNFPLTTKATVIREYFISELKSIYLNAKANKEKEGLEGKTFEIQL